MSGGTNFILWSTKCKVDKLCAWIVRNFDTNLFELFYPCGQTIGGNSDTYGHEDIGMCGS